MMFDFDFSLRMKSSEGGAPAPPTVIWLGDSLTAAPALSGAPAGATYLNDHETTQLTRGGITMRARGAGVAYNNALFASAPGWVVGNQFQGLELTLAAGAWQIGIVAGSMSWGGGVSGTVFIVDNPAGAATVRQTLPLSGSGSLFLDTDGTAFTNAGTAIADVFGALTLVPVTVSNLGGGNGLVHIYGSGAAMQIAAIAVRAG